MEYYLFFFVNSYELFNVSYTHMEGQLINYITYLQRCIYVVYTYMSSIQHVLLAALNTPVLGGKTGKHFFHSEPKDFCLAFLASVSLKTIAKKCFLPRHKILWILNLQKVRWEAQHLGTPYKTIHLLKFVWWSTYIIEIIDLASFCCQSWYSLNYAMEKNITVRCVNVSFPYIDRKYIH